MATKGFTDLFGEELYGAVVEFARLQTVEIMNYVAEEGPAWSGQFRDSWRARQLVPAAPGRAEPQYPYELRDIPRPSYNAETYKKKTNLFTINNESSHKPYAVDAREGIFYPHEEYPEPIKEPVVRGSRAQDRFSGKTVLRGAVIPGDGEASATAPEGWFQQASDELPQVMRARKVELIRKAKRTMREKMRRRRAK